MMADKLLPKMALLEIQNTARSLSRLEASGFMTKKQRTSILKELLKCRMSVSFEIAHIEKFSGKFPSQEDSGASE